ncbi:MAG: Smr/MutS family protein [Rickettsiales bacterium]|nr:Smr/MutS family protein [Rickettsiales bacterium]
MHGCNIDNAYCKLIDFIVKNYQAGNRCLLIITGHGNTTDRTDTIKYSLNK